MYVMVKVKVKERGIFIDAGTGTAVDLTMLPMEDYHECVRREKLLAIP